ncbi:MAG: FAD-dependent monooxygenase [Alphaproteobacteria bacterium]|nr:FAD-dependent monooxygenase [Alphaproteobacteria bacterium]
MDSRTPVIVVGGGPAGLAVAVGLALQDVAVTVYEAESRLPRDLRAGSFHPPTLEMLDSIGVDRDFRALGYRVPRWQIRGRREGVIVEWDLSLIADLTPYPFRFHCEQFKLTPLLLKRLEALGGTVRWRHRFLDATQGADGVAARFETPDGIYTVRGSYLVGADGGRSAVRHTMNVAFEGFTWPERFLVVGIDRDLAPAGLTMNAYISDPVDWSAIFKMPHDGPPGLWRVLIPTDAEVPEEEVLNADFIERSLQNFLPWDRPYGIAHKSTYRVHQRVASDFRQGRMLLVGDAAHVNNPLGAFGLNGALHGAFNLVEKLGPVWRGEAPDSLLDRYVRQRRAANVEFVQAQSIRNKQLLEERDPARRAERLDEIRRIAADKTLHKEYLIKSSMIWSVRRAVEVE